MAISVKKPLQDKGKLKKRDYNSRKVKKANLCQSAEEQRPGLVRSRRRVWRARLHAERNLSFTPNGKRKNARKTYGKTSWKGVISDDCCRPESIAQEKEKPHCPFS